MTRLTTAFATAAITFAAAAPAWAADVKPGSYNVTGTDSKRGSYTGEVRISPIDATKVALHGVYVYDSGGKSSFSATGHIKGEKLTFTIASRTHGIIDALGRLVGGHGTVKTYFTGTYTIGDGSLTGTWTSSNDSSFSKTDTWTQLALRVDSVDPRDLEQGAKSVTVTIHGRDLPQPYDLSTKDVAFTLDGKDDASIKVKSLGERADDGSTLQITVDVDQSAKTGSRGIRVQSTKAEDVANVVPGGPALPLGGSADFKADESRRLTIPLPNGKLRLTADGGTVKLLDPSGKEVAGDLAVGVDVANAGVYVVRLEGAKGSVSDAYSISGETKPENKPYNFWYWPFYTRSNYDGTSLNLYADGGTYEKLDKVFGLKADSNAAKFDPANHMDSNTDYTKPEYVFKMPTDSKEKARYTTSTTKGFAWCYQRSTDPDKSWWGHCWGAVIASSLHRHPHDKTVTAADGSSVEFSEEQVKGILSSYYTDHNIEADFLFSSCPPGRPTDKTGEPCDAYADDLWRGLVTYVKTQGLPLAANLRAEATDDKQNTEVWNHVVWKFDADLKQVEKQDDPNYVEISIACSATNDVYPSDDSQQPRRETYVIRLRTKDGSVVSKAQDQNWVSASHFCPSYLARITSSATGDPGCKNEALGQRIGIKKLVAKFGFESMEPSH